MQGWSHTSRLEPSSSKRRSSSMTQGAAKCRTGCMGTTGWGGEDLQDSIQGLGFTSKPARSATQGKSMSLPAPVQGRATKRLRRAWCFLGDRAAERSQRAIGVACGTPRGHRALGIGDSGPGVVTLYVLTGAGSRGDGDSRALCVLAGQSTSRAIRGTTALRIKDRYIFLYLPCKNCEYLYRGTDTRVEVSRRLHTKVLTTSLYQWWDLGFAFHCALSLFSKCPTIYTILLV